jgi:hypothetical protein
MVTGFFVDPSERVDGQRLAVANRQRDAFLTDFPSRSCDLLRRRFTHAVAPLGALDVRVRALAQTHGQGL